MKGWEFGLIILVLIIGWLFIAANPHILLKILTMLSIEEEEEPYRYEWIFDTVSHKLEPTDTYLRGNWTMFRYNISASENDLESYGMNITWNNTVWNSTVDTSPSGGVIEINFTIKNETLEKTGYIYVTPWFKKTGYDQYNFTVRFNIWWSV